MLIKCPDCGKMRSSDAAACPFCGCKRKPGGCSGFIVVLIMLALVTLCDSKEPYVVQRNANFREEPNGKILGQISKGTELSCNIEDGWCRTTYAGRIVFGTAGKSGSGIGPGRRKLIVFLCWIKELFHEKIYF